LKYFQAKNQQNAVKESKKAEEIDHLASLIENMGTENENPKIKNTKKNSKGF
jgi:hypothetical protein